MYLWTVYFGRLCIPILGLGLLPRSEEPSGLPDEPGVYYESHLEWQQLQYMGARFRGPSRWMAVASFGAAGWRSYCEFDEPTSGTVVAETRPTFFMRYDEKTSLSGKQHKPLCTQEAWPCDPVVIVRLKQKKRKRVLQVHPFMGPYRGFRYMKSDIVPVQAKRLSQAVLAVTPAVDLTPGEYLVSTGIRPAGRLSGPLVNAGYGFTVSLGQ